MSRGWPERRRLFLSHHYAYLHFLLASILLSEGEVGALPWSSQMRTLGLAKAECRACTAAEGQSDLQRQRGHHLVELEMVS